MSCYATFIKSNEARILWSQNLMNVVDLESDNGHGRACSKSVGEEKMTAKTMIFWN